MMNLVKAGRSPWCKSGWLSVCLLLLLVCLSGCAARLDRASSSFYADQPEQALAILQEGDNFARRSQLLFLMEQGVVLHQLGRYQDSVKLLLDAAQLSREFETISASEQLSSLVTSERLVRYQGEYGERLWIHSYQMMNFLLLAQYDDALVEAKQALDLLGRYPEALKQDYFSRALIALCFSTLREDNDAYLVYRNLAADLPTPRAVAADLVQISSRLGLLDEVEHYRPYLPERLPEGEAELVLFVANGRIPKKRPGNLILPPSIRFSFPYYPKTSTPQLQVKVIAPQTAMLPPISADFATVIRRSLEERIARLLVKETSRVVAKEAISRQVGNRQGDLAEALTRIALFLLEEPDTRSWQTLPARMTLLRIPLPAGSHRIRLELATGGYRQQQRFDLPEFQLRKGERLFRTLRF